MGVYTSANLSSIAGFDIDYLKLLFHKILLPKGHASGYSVILLPQFADLFGAVRDGVCDAAVGGIDVTGTRLGDCAAPPAAPCPVPAGGFMAQVAGDDYADAGWVATNPSVTFQCCIDFSVPYATSMWQLVSVPPVPKVLNPVKGLFSADIANVVTALATGSFILTFIFWLCEKDSVDELTQKRMLATFHMCGPKARRPRSRPRARRRRACSAPTAAGAPTGRSSRWWAATRRRCRRRTAASFSISWRTATVWWGWASSAAC